MIFSGAIEAFLSSASIISPASSGYDPSEIRMTAPIFVGMR
jgi:hypothetical protein